MLFAQTPTYVIAEAGVNHDGDPAKARMLIDIAADAKADAVKFQLFSPKLLVTEKAPKADYQTQNLGNKSISQRQMLENLSLPQETFKELAAYCEKRGLDFLCTPFDVPSLDYLITHTRMPYLKLASGEVTHGPLLLACARSKLPVILSTGMSNLEEIAVALSILHFGHYHADGTPKTLGAPSEDMLAELQDKVALLHCVSQYPAPPESMNLRAMQTMVSAFGLTVGLSDHSLGTALSIAAVARGAAIIEKHFTYNPKAPGPDHAASLSAEELAAMIAGIRDTERALGDGHKMCQTVEDNTRLVARRSVVASTAIHKGAVFSEHNLICKRPGNGPLAPNKLWELLGKPAKRDYAADDIINSDELE